MNFSISIIDSSLTRLTVEGELDIVTGPELRKDIDKLLASRPSRLEIDLSSLRMIDSSGVGVLVSLFKRVRAQGGEIIVTGLRGQPLEIFRLLQLSK
jgi:anti-sigma B factor antagonist